MRILIEALGINRPGGGRTATMNLLRPLPASTIGNEYVIVLSAPERSLMGLSPRASQDVIPIRSRFASRLFLQAMLPFICRRRRIDVVHFVKNQTVLTAGVKSIVTVYRPDHAAASRSLSSGRCVVLAQHPATAIPEDGSRDRHFRGDRGRPRFPLPPAA